MQQCSACPCGFPEASLEGVSEGCSECCAKALRKLCDGRVGRHGNQQQISIYIYQNIYEYNIGRLTTNKSIDNKSKIYRPGWLKGHIRMSDASEHS